jgi:hypothetical protein
LTPVELVGQAGSMTWVNCCYNFESLTWRDCRDLGRVLAAVFWAAGGGLVEGSNAKTHFHGRHTFGLEKKKRSEKQGRRKEKLAL